MDANLDIKRIEIGQRCDQVVLSLGDLEILILLADWCVERSAPLSIFITRFTVNLRTNGLLRKIFVVGLLRYLGPVLLTLLIFTCSFPVRRISIDSHGSVRLNICKFEIEGSTV